MLWWFFARLLIILIIYGVKKLVELIYKPVNYWKVRDIKYVPGWPLFGNNLNPILGRQSHADNFVELYKHFPEERYVGITQFTTPYLIIRDLDLLKQIAVKDFDYFTDHKGGEIEEVDPLMGKNIFLLGGQKWRDMRRTLSPAFTTSKMRAMFILMQECAKEFVENFTVQASEKTVQVEMKDLLCYFTNDVIATCAFGQKCNSLNDRNNEFYKMGLDGTNFKGFQGIKFLMLLSAPGILKFLRLPFIPKHVTKFFRQVVDETIAYRERTKLIRPDMIHLLMEAKKGNIRHEAADEEIEETGYATVKESNEGRGKGKEVLTNEDIAAQVYIFYLGGFDTVATSLSFLVYELAVSVEIQERLRREVDETLGKCDSGEPTYEKIARMTYLDMVVSETIRKWSPAIQIDRLCMKDYIIEPKLPTEKQITIEKGTMISIPISGIHKDNKYFPNPDKFDPERFSEENKNKIVPGSYIPFGMGPRSCIGNRFALLEIKVFLFYLLSKFEITVTEKTIVPMKLDKTNVSIAAEGGLYLGLKLRTNI